MSLVSPVSFVRNKAECGVELQMKVSKNFTITEKTPSQLKVSRLKTRHPSLVTCDLCVSVPISYLLTIG